LPAAGRDLADPQGLGGLCGGQALPRDEEQQVALNRRERTERRHQLTSLRLRVEPGRDRVPVHPGVSHRVTRWRRAAQVVPQHVGRDAVQPRQRASAMVRHQPGARPEGRDEDLREQVLRRSGPRPPGQVAEHRRGVPLVQDADQFRPAAQPGENRGVRSVVIVHVLLMP
jgi:hypothetical protein